MKHPVTRRIAACLLAAVAMLACIPAATAANLTIGGLTIGRTYRLQIICNVLRNGVAEVAGGKHRLSNGEVKTPALLTATWEASTGTLTKRRIGQRSPGTPVHFSAYALHDLGLTTVDGKCNQNNKP